MSAGPVSRRDALERDRDRLLARLHARSDDVAASKELQAVSRELATVAAHGGDERPDRLRRRGLSFFDRLRSGSRPHRARRRAAR